MRELKKIKTSWPQLIYSQPYLENRLILVGRQGSDVSATSLASGSPWLPGMRMARQSRRTGRSSHPRTAKKSVSQNSSTVRRTKRYLTT